jgi:hypothetical protein
VYTTLDVPRCRVSALLVKMVRFHFGLRECMDYPCSLDELCGESILRKALDLARALDKFSMDLDGTEN